jgi:glycosyltransferase involved in cell wall biosynthesis
VDVLIEAYALLPKNLRQEHPLRIIGEGSERPRLGALAEKRGVKVEFTGKIESHEDVIALLKAADLFIMPSRRESFGITVLEAMYCGVPVISTATEGPSDHVKNAENGFLVPIGGAAEMAKRMEEVLSNSRLQKTLASNARNYAARHDWESIVERVAGVYKKVLGDSL